MANDIYFNKNKNTYSDINPDMYVEKLENTGENTFERTDLLQYSRSLPQC